MCGANRANNTFVCQPDGRRPPLPLTPWPAQKLEVSQFRGDSFLFQKHTVFGSKNISRGKVVLDLLKFHRMSGLQPPILPPPPIPMPSPSVLAEELYKCANPPPSYSVAVGAPDATPVQGRHQLQTREVIVGPFGGSLCRVVPMTSAQLEPPPAYSRRSPSNETTAMDRLFMCCARIDKDKLCLAVACVGLTLATLSAFLLLEKFLT